MAACLQANGGVAQQAARLQKELREKDREIKTYSDSGSPMKGALLLETLYQLEIIPFYLDKHRFQQSFSCFSVKIQLGLRENLSRVSILSSRHS